MVQYVFIEIGYILWICLILIIARLIIFCNSSGKRQKEWRMDDMIQGGSYLSPIGRIWIAVEEEKIVGISIGEDGNGIEESGLEQSEVLKEAKRQLAEYFNGSRREFRLPLKFRGTDFQEKVWRALQTIPYGQTRSYGEIAAIIGNPKASRAVGGANHKNPILIVVPCHRVIGADGSLVGFGCGLAVKKYLLELERKNLS